MTQKTKQQQKTISKDVIAAILSFGVNNDGHFAMFLNDGPNPHYNQVFIKGKRENADLTGYDKGTNSNISAGIVKVDGKDPFYSLNIYLKSLEVGVGGVLFKKIDKEEGSKQPDYTGRVDGILEGYPADAELRIAGWKGKTKEGKIMISGTFSVYVPKPKEAGDASAAPEQTPEQFGGEPATADDDGLL